MVGHGDGTMDNMLPCSMRRYGYVILPAGKAAEMRSIHTMWDAAPYRAKNWKEPLDIEDDFLSRV
jgi:hypothetical protein